MCTSDMYTADCTLTIREGSGNGSKRIRTDMVVLAGGRIGSLKAFHYPPLCLLLLPSTQ